MPSRRVRLAGAAWARSQSCTRCLVIRRDNGGNWTVSMISPTASSPAAVAVGDAVVKDEFGRQSAHAAACCEDQDRGGAECGPVADHSYPPSPVTNGSSCVARVRTPRQARSPRQRYEASPEQRGRPRRTRPPRQLRSGLTAGSSHRDNRGERPGVSACSHQTSCLQHHGGRWSCPSDASLMS